MVDELVRAAAGGDEDAFAQLVALHEKKVYNLALRMCGNPEDAWDAAQEAFLSAWRGLPSFRGEAGFSTWLYRLTSNAAIDLLRRTRRQRGEASLDDENLGIDAVDRTPSPQEQAEASELRGAVTAGLSRLTDSHRQALVLREVQGLSYEEIAKRGGGILNSADRLHETSEDELYAQAMERVREIVAMGTGCVEIKSGYGLTTEDELKMLRVIRRIRETAPLEVRATFLGAHAVARGYVGRQAEYVDLVCREMIPAVAREGLADFVDVFCDQGFFTVEETERIMRAGAEYGLVPKIHANELAVSGGVQAGVRHGALSVDHLERMDEAAIEALRGTRTMPTMLPGAAFFLGMSYPPAREMIAAGLGVALASDYNPGSSPSGNMKTVVSLACIRMRMTPAEAINAATLNSAYAMGLSRDFGSITVGKVANFFLTKPMPSVAFFPYAYTTPVIRRVFLRGQEVA